MTKIINLTYIVFRLSNTWIEFVEWLYTMFQSRCAANTNIILTTLVYLFAKHVVNSVRHLDTVVNINKHLQRLKTSLSSLRHVCECVPVCFTEEIQLTEDVWMLCVYTLIIPRIFNVIKVHSHVTLAMLHHSLYVCKRFAHHFTRERKCKKIYRDFKLRHHRQHFLRNHHPKLVTMIQDPLRYSQWILS